jgi:hypothetical protein
MVSSSLSLMSYFSSICFTSPLSWKLCYIVFFVHVVAIELTKTKTNDFQLKSVTKKTLVKINLDEKCTSGK